MRPRATLVLLALCVIAAAYIFFVERKKPTEEETAEKAKALLTLEPKDVTRIRIETDGGVVVSERSDSMNWVLTEPVRDRAENSTVEGVLTQLKSLKAERVFAPEDSLAAYGLADPAVVVSIETSKRSHTVEIGDKSPTGDGYYARVDASPNVGVVPAFLVEGQLRKSVSDFRDKRLADFPLERARRVVLESESGGRIEMTRETAEGEWTIVSPATLEADASAVNNLVNRFRFLRAREFVDDPSGDFGFGDPAVRLTVRLDDGTSHTLTLGRAEREDVFAQVSGRATVYRVPESTRNDLSKTVVDLRDRRVMDFEPNDAVGLTLEMAGRRLVAEKDSAGIWRYADDGKTAVKWRIEDPVRNLSLLRVEAYPGEGITEAAAGLDTPYLVVTVRLSDGSAHVARYGMREGTNVYVTGEKGPRIVLVTTTAMTQMESILNERPVEAAPPASS